MISDTALTVVLATPFGLVLGSFMTVVVDRVPSGESVVAPRSKCPACGTQILVRDNVPVLSWILLRGRCRSCGERISPLYPFLEIATAALFVGAFLAYESVWMGLGFAVFLTLMPALAVIDLEHRIIPNRVIYPALIGFPLYFLVARLAGAPVNLVGIALGFLLYGGGLFVLALISPRGMGMGDVKLAALIGLVVGALGIAEVGVAAAAGVLLGGAVALIALALGASRKSALPFGPSLTAGAVVAVFWGTQIAQAYVNRIG
jgi:leader peptidase (prepilin peptidase)/N-methyltransferase